MSTPRSINKKKAQSSPEKRDCKMSYYAVIILLSILCLFSIFRYDKLRSHIILELKKVFIYFLSLRIFRFIPEVQYWRKHHKKNSLSSIISRTIHLSFENGIYVFLLSMCLIFTPFDNLESGDVFMNLFLLLFLPTVLTFLNFRGMDNYPTKKAMEIEEDWSSLATGFYYGYLKIILPTLVEKIDGYIDTKRITQNFPVKKLFVLIPSSLVLFDNVKTLCKDNVEGCENLIEYKCTRALVIDRSYKNSVYCLKDSETNQRYYCVCEGATPLKTFYEQCKEEPSLFDYKRETIYSFYTTLKKLLDKDPEIKHFVELLYYEDDEKPGHGSRQKGLPDIIIERIKEIIAEQDKSR